MNNLKRYIGIVWEKRSVIYINYNFFVRGIGNFQKLKSLTRCQLLFWRMYYGLNTGKV